MFEIEIKAQLDDQISSEIFESATDLGFTVCWRGVEEDVYYNGNDRDFRQTDEALRIRTQRALAPAISTTTLITYKGPKAVGPTQSRTELETAVADDDVMRDILDHLGYPSVMTVRKTRVELDGEYVRQAEAQTGFLHTGIEKTMEYRMKKLIETLETTDSLIFKTNELEAEADNARLPEVTGFVESHLELIGCPMKTVMQIDVAVEEIFVNIANYAYAPGSGKATVRVEAESDTRQVTITFTDGGKPFDPTAKADPDVTLSADERDIGGLGIFMTKKIMDSVEYEYKDGKNVLVLKKVV